MHGAYAMLCVMICGESVNSTISTFVFTTKEKNGLLRENSRPGDDSLDLPNAIVAQRLLTMLLGDGERCGYLEGLFAVAEFGLRRKSDYQERLIYKSVWYRGV